MYVVILVVCQLSSYARIDGPVFPISGFRQCYLSASEQVSYPTSNECQTRILELASIPEPDTERHFLFCINIPEE